jgi:hypothetical protein
MAIPMSYFKQEQAITLSLGNLVKIRHRQSIVLVIKILLAAEQHDAANMSWPSSKTLAFKALHLTYHRRCWRP